MALSLTETGSSYDALGALGTQGEAEVREIWVTVEKVTARVDGSWVTLFTVPEAQGKLNLMDLRFRQTLLAAGEIPAGKYSEIRFQLKPNASYIVFQDGSTAPLQVPSNELKPELNLALAHGTAVELVFNVDLRYLVERGSTGSYNVNPRKALCFLESFQTEFASIKGEIELPDLPEELISIELQLFRVGQETPIWFAVLQNGKLSFEITSLPEGEYRLEAELVFLGGSLSLKGAPFYLEGGTQKPVSL